MWVYGGFVWGFDWFSGGVVLVICEFGCWVGLVQLAG